MRHPSPQALSGLWKALNAAEATPTGGDFTEEGRKDVLAAIEWLQKNQAGARVAKVALGQRPYRY